MLKFQLKFPSLLPLSIEHVNITNCRWECLPLFGKYKTNGISMGALCPTLILFVQWGCIRRRHLRVRHLFSDTSQHSSIRCFSVQPKVPTKNNKIMKINAGVLNGDLFSYFSKTAFSQHRQKMKIVDRIFFESWYRCCRSGYRAGSLKLSIRVWGFYNVIFCKD